jgi:hypothetical protein
MTQTVYHYRNLQKHGDCLWNSIYWFHFNEFSYIKQFIVLSLTLAVIFCAWIEYGVKITTETNVLDRYIVKNRSASQFYKVWR